MSNFSEIRDKVDIIDVYETETGNEYRSKKGSPCAFCASSDAVHFHKGRYKCFSCGWSGGVIDFIANLKRIAPPEAGRFIENKYMNGEALELANIERPAHQREHRPEVQYKFNPEINARFFALCEESEGDPELNSYLDNRGFTADIRKIWHIATISQADYYRINRKLKKEFSPEALIKSGLFSEDYDKAGNVTKYNLLFAGHRILIFNYNDEGQIIGVEGRATPNSPNDASGKKYFANKGTKYPFATSAIYNALRGGKIFICEGKFDAIALNELGIPAVAVGGVSGAGDSPVFRGLLQKIAKRGLIAVCGFDNDEAGKNRENFAKVASSIEGLKFIPDMEYKTDKKDFADLFQDENGECIPYTLRDKNISIAEKYINRPDVLNVRELASIELVQPFEIRRGFMDLIRYFNMKNITFSENYDTITII